MSNHHAERRPYLGSYPAVTSEHHESMLGGSLRHSPQRQYIQQLHPHVQHPYTSAPQPYPPSYPMDRLSAVSVSPAPQYSHTPPPSSGSGSGYLDPFNSMPMPDVMSMDMDSLGGLGGMDLSILDAQEHRDMRVLEDRARRSQETLGSSEPLMDSGSGRGKGRQRRAQSDDTSETDPSVPTRGGRGGNRKQRGRPRLDTKDENAQDRRRTQIRLAQRAYRLRKETTISSLRNRVSELETAIEGMQSTFLELHESAMNCIQNNKERGMYGPGLREITERFLSLAKGALGSSEGGETGAEDEGTDAGQSTKDPVERGERSERRRRSRDDSSPNGGLPDRSSGVSTTWGGYQISYDRATSQNRSSYQYNSSQEPRDSAPKDVMETSQSERSEYTQSGSFDISQQRPDEDSYTYSYHETTFSRRLHRAGLERAYQLLTCPTADQNEVARTFAYTFCYASREDVIRDIARALSTNRKGDGIEEYPELTQLAKHAMYDEIEGLANSPSNDKNAQLRTEAYKGMMKLGVNEKYLRPDDVERMLLERGILTTSSTSSIVSLDDDPVPGHASPSSSTSSASELAEARTPEELALSPTFPRTTEDILFGIPHSDPAFVDELDKKDSIKVVQGVKSYVDIALLIKELLERGVCLGRYPGFQKQDVDAAISIASRY